MEVEDRESLVFQAQMAEQAERYEDMTDAMKKLVNASAGELNKEEQILFSTSYKSLVVGLRTAHRIVDQKLSNSDNPPHFPGAAKAYQLELVKKLTEVCLEVLSLLNDHLLPKAHGSPFDEAFYMKTKGDYSRYLAEVRNEVFKDEALAAYIQAHTIALKHLPPPHPVRLGIALNFSVFYFEIMKSTKEAYDVAEQAFDEAIMELDTMNTQEDEYNESMTLMKFLKDNIALWSVESEQSGEQNDQL